MSSNANELKDLQEWMQTALFYPTKNDAFTNQYIAPSNTLAPAQRLAIYQRAYYSRLLQCMREQFKALAYTLGNDLFDDFAREYLQSFPSQSPNLGDLGERFPDFLRNNRPDKDAEEPEKWVDFMIAMAQFERDLYHIFDKPGSEGEKLADVDTPDDAMRFQNCFLLRTYPFLVNHYYQAVAAGNNPDIPFEEATYVAFVRTNYQVFIIGLTQIQYHFLNSLQISFNIEAAKKSIYQQFNLMAERVDAKWLEWKKDWTKQGLFVVNENSYPI